MSIEREGAVSGYKSHKEIDFESKQTLSALLADFRINNNRLKRYIDLYLLKSATLLKSQSVAAQTAKNAIFLVWTDFLPCVG